MCCKGFTKRFLPFFLTFAVGLFIASFFVSIAAPSFQFPNRGSRKKHRDYDNQREAEIKQLREENQRLKNEAQTNTGNFKAVFHMNSDGSAGEIEQMEMDGIPVNAPTVQTVPRRER